MLYNVTIQLSPATTMSIIIYYEVFRLDVCRINQFIVANYRRYKIQKRGVCLFTASSIFFYFYKSYCIGFSNIYIKYNIASVDRIGLTLRIRPKRNKYHFRRKNILSKSGQIFSSISLYPFDDKKKKILEENENLYTRDDDVTKRPSVTQRVSSMHRFRKSTFPLPPSLSPSPRINEIAVRRYWDTACCGSIDIYFRRSSRPCDRLGLRFAGETGGELADPSAFSVNLFGIPEILEALPSAISPARLHNIVFISSCNPAQGGHQPLSADSPSSLVGGDSV